MTHADGPRPAPPPSPIDCEEALRRLAEWLDSELPALHARALEAHLDTCASCYSRAEFERRLKERMQAELGQVVLPPGLEDRVRALIHRLPHSSSTSGDPPWS